MSDYLKHRLRIASFIAFDDGGNDYTTAGDALAAIKALEAQVRAADALADALTAYNRGGAGPLTGWLDVEQALAAYRATKEGGA